MLVLEQLVDLDLIDSVVLKWIDALDEDLVNQFDQVKQHLVLTDQTCMTVVAEQQTVEAALSARPKCSRSGLAVELAELGWIDHHNSEYLEDLDIVQTGIEQTA